MPFKSFTECQLATAVTGYRAPNSHSRLSWALLALLVWVGSLCAVRAVERQVGAVQCHDLPAASTQFGATFATSVATGSDTLGGDL